MKALLIFLFATYGFYSCVSNATKPETMPAGKPQATDPFTFINEGKSLLKEGDLVVRLNRDPTSQFIKNFNRQDKSYSHAGIVLFENGLPYVYHIVNGVDDPEEKLRMDSLSLFCDPRKNLAFGIYRYDLSESEIKNLKSLIHKWQVKGVKFDYRFDLKSDDRMYCSEMICKALGKITSKRICPATTELTETEARLFSAYMHLPPAYTGKLKIVSIDNLYNVPGCKLIKEYNYETK
jgi:hypothetical protein